MNTEENLDIVDEKVKLEKITTPKGIEVDLVTIDFGQKINWDNFDQLLSTPEFSEITIEKKITIIIDNTSIAELFFSLYSGEIKDKELRKVALESLITKLGPLFGKCKMKPRIIYFYPKRAAMAKVLSGDPQARMEQGLRHEITHLKHLPDWFRRHKITDFTLLRNTYIYLCEALLGIAGSKIAIDAIDKYEMDPAIKVPLKIGVIVGTLFILKHSGFNTYRNLPIEIDAQKNEKVHMDLSLFE